MKMGTWGRGGVSDGEVLVQTRLLKHPSCSETISVGGTQLQRQGVDLASIQNPSFGVPGSPSPFDSSLFGLCWKPDDPQTPS